MFAHELLNVIRTERILAARTRAFPSAERLHSRPGAGCGAAAAIAISHACFDPGEELFLFLSVLSENAGGQAIAAVIGKADCLVEGFNVSDSKDRREKFFFEQFRILRRIADDCRLDKKAVAKLAFG